MLPMLLLLLFLLLSTGAGGFSICGFQSAASRPTRLRLQHRRPATPGGARPDVGQQEREQPPPVRVQSMDYTTLLRVGGELRRRLVPGRVENAVQPDDYRCVCDGSYTHGHTHVGVGGQGQAPLSRNIGAALRYPVLSPLIHTHTSLMLQIRSLEGLDWLVLSWHPEAARVTLLQPSRSAYGGQEKEGKCVTGD